MSWSGKWNTLGKLGKTTKMAKRTVARAKAMRGLTGYWRAIGVVGVMATTAVGCGGAGRWGYGDVTLGAARDSGRGSSDGEKVGYWLLARARVRCGFRIRA